MPKEIFKYDTVDFLMKYIELRSILYVPEKNHLTQREKEYLIACIIKNSEGKNLLSSEVKNYLQTKWMFKNRSVDIYRGKLKEKEWIIQTKDGIKLPPDMDFNGKIPRLCTYNFAIKIKE